MKKENKIIIGVIVVALAIVLGYVLPHSQSLGGDFSYTSFTGITSATSSIGTSATTTAIYSGVGYEANVEICNTQTNVVYLYLVSASTATTTGEVVSKGVFLDGFGNTTSTSYACRQFNKFNGDIRGVAGVATVVLVNYSR